MNRCSFYWRPGGHATALNPPPAAAAAPHPDAPDTAPAEPRARRAHHPRTAPRLRIPASTRRLGTTLRGERVVYREDKHRPLSPRGCTSGSPSVCRRQASSTSPCTSCATPPARSFIAPPGSQADADVHAPQVDHHDRRHLHAPRPDDLEEAMRLAYLRGRSSPRRRQTKCRSGTGLEAPSGFEPLYEALQASA